MKGDLTIDNINEFKTQIQEQIKDKTTIKLKTDDVEGIDLPFYQFIVSLKKTSEKQNQVLILDINLPEDKETLFTNSGLDFNLN
jgi:ABC-type transporter Mla MlaB component